MSKKADRPSKIQLIQDKKVERNGSVSYLVIYKDINQQAWASKQYLCKDFDNKKTIERFQKLMGTNFDQSEKEEDIQESVEIISEPKTKIIKKNGNRGTDDKNKKPKTKPQPTKIKQKQLQKQSHKEIKANEKSKIQSQKQSKSKRRQEQDNKTQEHRPSTRSSKPIISDKQAFKAAFLKSFKQQKKEQPKELKINFKPQIYVQESKQRQPEPKRNTKQKSFEMKSENNNEKFKILKARINTEKNIEYQVVNEKGIISWVNAEGVKKKYPLQVINFYEKKIMWSCQ